MKRHISKGIFLLILLFCTIGSKAQKQNSTYQSYIQNYSSMAIDQMNRYGIPASITLAQGLLESGGGTSYLAVYANNHFGIKVSSGWNGPYVLRDDDKKNDKFRKYNNVAESYEDHSIFLTKPRYSSLFRYGKTDYKRWAHGLKACGYATSPTYAQNLIELIELYNLGQYDYATIVSNSSNELSGTLLSAGYAIGNQQSSSTYTSGKKLYHLVSNGNLSFFTTHKVYQNNKNYFIRIQKGDKLADIAKQVGVKERKLRKYNELPKKGEPKVGAVLYLESKRSKADKGFKNHPHAVRAGESLYDIAQMYGIKLSSLYKRNNLMPDYQPSVGDQLWVY